MFFMGAKLPAKRPLALPGPFTGKVISNKHMIWNNRIDWWCVIIVLIFFVKNCHIFNISFRNCDLGLFFIPRTKNRRISSLN